MRRRSPLPPFAWGLARWLAFRPAFRPVSRCFRLILPRLVVLALFAAPSAFGKECMISPGEITTTDTNRFWFGNYGDDGGCDKDGGSPSDAWDPTQASNNTVTANGVTIQGSTGNIYGAYTSSSLAATNNRVFLYDSTVNGSIFGLYKSSDKADNTSSVNNQVFLFGKSEVKSNVYGGRSQYGSATNNQVFLFGESVVNSDVYGGMRAYNDNAKDAPATGNQIFLYDNSTLAGTGTGLNIDPSSKAGNINGGWTNVDETSDPDYLYLNHFKGNTLNINRSSQPEGSDLSLTVKGLYSLQFLNFTLPGDIKDIDDDNPSAPLLTVTEALWYTRGCRNGSTTCDSDEKVTLDIRTPGSFSLEVNGNNSLNGTYVLLRTTGTDENPLKQGTIDHGAVNSNTIEVYTLYGKSFTKNNSTDLCDVTSLTGNDGCSVTLPAGGRVGGSFTIKLVDENKDLRLTVGNDYSAPNKALVWNGSSDSLWSNYNVDSSKSPKIWSESGQSGPNIAYLDGDTVTFGDIGSDPNTITITIQGGVIPKSVTFDNTNTHYILKGDPLVGQTGLKKTGTGILTLQGANAYSGGTIIEGGLINFNSLANFGNYPFVDENDTSKNGKITLDGGGLQWATNTTNDISRWLNPIGEGGGTFDTNDNNVTFSSPITGIGGIVKEGSGTLTLAADTGTNTYRDTFVLGGTLAGNIPSGRDLTVASGATYDGLDTSHAIGALNGAGTVTNNDVLTVQSGDFSGQITGTARLTKTSADTLILRGASGYTGGTTIEAGTIRVGNDRALGTGGVTMSDDTTLGFVGNHSLNNVFTLQSESGGKATFQTDAGLTATLTGALTGDTSTLLVKEGTGKLILNASGNSAGTVNVNAGQFIVGGSKDYRDVASLTATSIDVQSGGLLGGHGTVAGIVTIGSGGILSPGNSIGTLTIDGTLTLEGTSHFEVEVDPDNPGVSDQVQVNGTAILKEGTSISHVGDAKDLASYAVPGKKWLILSVSADGRIALNADAIAKKSNLGLFGLLPELDYDPVTDPNNLYLYFLMGKPDDPIISLLCPGNPVCESLLELSEDQLHAVLDEFRVSGEAATTLKGMILTRDDTFVRRLRRHVGARSTQSAVVPSAGDGAWIRVDRSRATADGGDGIARATWTGTEIAFGHDAKFSNGWLGGVAFGLDDGRQEVKDRRAEADVIRSTAALYGGREFPAGPGTLRLLLTGAVTRHDVESERRVRIVGDSQKLEARYDVQSFTGAFEAAYRISSAEKLFVEPYAALAWHHLRLDGFVEKGASAAALRRGGETWKRATSTLGLRFSTSPRERVSFDADVGWRHLYGSATPKSDFITFREGSGVPLPARGAPLNKDAALLGLSVGVKLSDSARLRLQYDGELGRRRQSHEGQVVLEVNF